MKKLIQLQFLFFTTTLYFSAAAANMCDQADTLFDAEYSYQCTDNKTNNKICINIGYHDGIELDGLRVFNPTNKNEPDLMIFHEPVFMQCRISSGFKACTHETVKLKGDTWVAKLYKAPDVWDRRSRKINFKLDTKSGMAQIQNISYGTNKEVESNDKRVLSQCQKL